VKIVYFLNLMYNIFSCECIVYPWNKKKDNANLQSAVN
jgi:hypothetical protein